MKDHFERCQVLLTGRCTCKGIQPETYVEPPAPPTQTGGIGQPSPVSVTVDIAHRKLIVHQPTEISFEMLEGWVDTGPNPYCGCTALGSCNRHNGPTYADVQEMERAGWLRGEVSGDDGEPKDASCGFQGKPKKRKPKKLKHNHPTPGQHGWWYHPSGTPVSADSHWEMESGCPACKAAKNDQ